MKFAPILAYRFRVVSPNFSGGWADAAAKMSPKIVAGASVFELGCGVGAALTSLAKVVKIR